MSHSNKQFPVLFSIEPNTYNAMKNKTPHEFSRFNTGFTDGLS